MEEIFGTKPWIKPICTETSSPTDSAEESPSYEPGKFLLLQNYICIYIICIRTLICNIKCNVVYVFSSQKNKVMYCC